MFHLLTGAVGLIFLFLINRKRLDLVGLVYSNILNWCGKKIARWVSSALSVPDPTLNTTRDFQYLPVELFEKALKWLWSALETKQTGWLSSGGCFRSSSPAAARRGPPLVWPVRQPPPTGVLSLVFREFVFSSTRPWFWYQSNTCTSLLSFPLLFDPVPVPGPGPGCRTVPTPWRSSAVDPVFWSKSWRGCRGESQVVTLL